MAYFGIKGMLADSGWHFNKEKKKGDDRENIFT